jgi:hypothetical protein
MIYKIKEYKNRLIEKAYKDGMKESGKFFGMNWIYSTPSICVFEKRQQFDLLHGRKTEGWVIGTAKTDILYILDNEKMEKESSHKKHSDEKYSNLIKHELCHLFYSHVSDGCRKPVWLTEGVSIYLSGQLKEKKTIEKFGSFLKFYEKGGGGVYSESGTAVKILIENFGKKKILKLISKSKESNGKSKFAKLFKQIYNFDLTYKNFNNLLNK